MIEPTIYRFANYKKERMGAMRLLKELGRSVLRLRHQPSTISWYEVLSSSKLLAQYSLKKRRHWWVLSLIALAERLYAI